MKLEAKARLTFDSVQFDQQNDAHLVISLKAPTIDWQAKRPRICIIPVIDISPSMDGEKIHYAKQSVMKLIDHLQPGDFCGIVAFGGEVFVVSKPVEVTQAQKDALKAKVAGLSSNGSTNFSGGMCQGLELVNKGDLPEGLLKRVIMFTDGMPNAGIATSRPDIVKLLESQLGIATLSAFGYGADADQELLADVAKTGKGNYAFIRNPEDALSAFAKELGGLLSTYAQNLVIDVAPHNGHSIEDVLSDVTSEEDGTKVKVKLSDILSEEERHIVFAVKLDKQTNAFPRESSVFDIRIDFDMLDGAQKVQHVTEELKAKVQFVKAADAQQKPTAEVDRIVALAQLVRVQIDAEERARTGDYDAAMKGVTGMGANFAVRGFEDLAGVAANVSSKMANAHVYASSSGYLNSMKSAGTRAYGTSSLDAEAAADMCAVGAAMTNSAQVQTMTGWADAAVGAGFNPTPIGAAGFGITGGPAMGGGVVGHGRAQGFVVKTEHKKQVTVVPFAPAPKNPFKGDSKKSKKTKSKSKRW